MRRLLWKELRERWIWLVPLSATTAGIVAIGDPYFFRAGFDTQWSFLSVLTALIFGTTAYSSELAAGVADFSRSRPTSWWKLLLAKIIIAAAILLVTAVLAAIVFRLACPAQYVQFAGFAELARGVGRALLVMGIPCLLGFVCSTVLPGGFALLVYFIVVVSCLLEVLVYNVFDLHIKSVFSFFFRFAGAAVATVLIARFGLTLAGTQRLTRFLAIVGVSALIGVPLNLTVKFDPFPGKRAVNSYSISADGRYAAVETIRPATGYHSYLVRLSDGKRAPTSWGSGVVDGPSAVWHKDAFAAITGDGRLSTFRMLSSGRLRCEDISLGSGCGTALTQSPGGRFVIVVTDSRQRPGSGLLFADLERLRLLAPRIESGVTDYWWQSDKEVIYIDARGQRHAIHLEG
jgi:ABC-type transport system involved in multi-copper enzyme maturation permease subunit